MLTMKKVFALLSCAMVLNAGSVLAAAAVTEPAPKQQAVLDIAPVRMPEMQSTRGEIIEINGDKIVVRGEGYYKTVAAIIGDDTYIVKGSRGRLKSASALKTGQQVTVYYSSRATRSLPPQSRAYAVVIGSPEDKLPLFFPVDQAVLAENGQSVRVLNANHDIIATIDKKACKQFAQIKKGDKLLVWSEIMTMSMPGQTNAVKAVILPAR